MEPQSDTAPVGGRTSPYRTRALLLATTTALFIVAVSVPFTDEYRPLGARMAMRYAENLDRLSATTREREAQATAEQRQREEATRQAEQQRQNAARQQALAEARARDDARAAVERQRAAEETKQRLTNGFDGQVAEFVRIVRTRRPPVIALMANVTKALEQIATASRQVDFYSSVGIAPEDATRGACNDPANTLDMLNRGGRRDRNILACGVYMALHRGENPEPGPQVMAALIQRVAYDDEAGHFPLQTIISYVWMRHFYAAAAAGEPPGPFPDLKSGEAINPELLRAAIPPSFARRLIETATPEEKLELVTHAYPDLRRMAELGERIAQACQVMKRTPCLTPT